MRRRDFLTSAAALGAAAVLTGATEAVPEGAQHPAPTPDAKLTPPAAGPIAVAFAVSKGTTWIDWVGPQAVFETWHFDPALKKHVPRFKLFTVGPSLEPVDNLIPDYSYATAPPANLVVVPAQSGSPALHEWLRKVHTTADLTMSVCTGAAQLARAGLLDGKRATTHHGAIDRFKKDYPKVEWVGGVRFVEAGAIATGGGLTAGIDLALRVVDRYFGRADARQVADHLEYRSTGWIV